MQSRSWIAGLIVALGLSAPLAAQTVRWNDRVAVDTVPETPTVRLWLEGTHTYAYGAPVRVWFNVSDDAYVVVARVDANGHLTVLHPSNRARTTEVRGGEDIQVRGRRGAASFYATDRVAGGFVFAMASYDPLDLTRLTSRDFDRYVTGMYVGRPTQVYIGDPHRIVTRFAHLVLYDDQSPFDYAVDYYNVDAPYYVTSAGFSNFCNGYYGQYRRGLAERWDDEMFYGDGMGALYNCGYSSYCSPDSYSGWGYNQSGLGFLNPLCFYPRSGQPGTTRPPTTPSASDSARVPVWITDSIRVGRPDTVGVVPERPKDEIRDGGDALRRGATALRRSATVTTGPGRPISVGDDDPSGRSYAIPGRALRNSPVVLGEERQRDGRGTPGPDRISPTPNDGSTIRWVRPPRDVSGGSQPPYGDGALPARAGGERGDRASGGYRNSPTTFVTGSDGRAPQAPVRTGPARFDPPTRSQGPRFDAPAPSVRNTFDTPRYDRSSRFDAPRGEGGRVSPPMGSAGSGTSQVGDQVRASPPPPPPAAASESPRPPASTGEKKVPDGA